VLLKAIGVTQHGGDTALCPAAGAVMARAFGDDCDALCLGELECCAQASQPTANDESVKSVVSQGVSVQEAVNDRRT
jgi:hypothetical protein